MAGLWRDCLIGGGRNGKGVVIGAGSVVTNDVPDGAVATGVPARVSKMRSDRQKIFDLPPIPWTPS